MTDLSCVVNCGHLSSDRCELFREDGTCICDHKHLCPYEGNVPSRGCGVLSGYLTSVECAEIDAERYLKG